MDWVSHTVSSFGQSVGIPQLALDTDGCVLFMLETGGMLGVHDMQPEGGDDVLIILSQPLPSPAAVCARRALSMTDFRVNPTWQTQLVMRSEQLEVRLRMPRHSFMLSTLEDAVEALFSFHERLAQAH